MPFFNLFSHTTDEFQLLKFISLLLPELPEPWASRFPLLGLLGLSVGPTANGSATEFQIVVLSLSAEGQAHLWGFSHCGGTVLGGWKAVAGG